MLSKHQIDGSRLTRQEVVAHIAKFPEGLRFGEIQRFIVESQGLNYDEKEVVNDWEMRGNPDVKPKYARVHRGWWCDNLIGSSWPDRKGILELFCKKVGNRYVVKS